jgi:hypothetical protein
MPKPIVPGNRHVHWHLAPLPPGVPYEDQQLAAVSMRRGILPSSAKEQTELAQQIRVCLVDQGTGQR